MNCIYLRPVKSYFYWLAGLSVCHLFGLQLVNPGFAEPTSHTVNILQRPTNAQTNPSNAPTQNAESAGVPILVKRIDIVGSTILSSSQIKQLTEPLIGKSASLSQIHEIADKITKIYQDGNFITSRAIVPPQEVKDGIVKIQVLEGKIERIDIKRAGNVEGRLSDGYIRDRIALGTNPPLNFTRLEEELRLLRADPLISDIKANLVSGSALDKNILQVTFSEAKTFAVQAFTDDYGNPSTGIFRVGTSVKEANLTGNGDSIFASYTRSGSSDNYGFGYLYPINPTGGNLSFNLSFGQGPVIESPFDTLNISTYSQIYEIAYHQPIIRSIREEFTLGLSFALENSSSFLNSQSFNFQNLLFGDGISQSRVLHLIQDYINRDDAGAWAFHSSFNFGLDILGATIRSDDSPDGRFFYWAGQALRAQRLGEDKDTLVSFRLNFQFAGNHLLSTNQFGIGGAQSVRGYQQSQFVGDNGIQGSIEFQFPALHDPDGVAIVKLLPFIDAGTVWNSGSTNTGTQSLLGIGLGTTYQPIRNLILRLDYGIPLINIATSSNNLQSSGLYFSVSGSF